uniref:Retrotransposon Gag domain, retroviral aspartyl protease n=1 Tax=Tanacetum cinerariifolium TaxID=118510 RepID=A0A6L2M8P6_TANCI|nr:retrotransposon Gag domain, retroviral aspartyl protease [Tanacetum cinerariifolium]
MESLKEYIADLKCQAVTKQRSGVGGSRYEKVKSSQSNHNRRPFHKIEFPVFSGGDPRGGALDLYSWMSVEREILYYEDLLNVLKKHFGPPEFQNLDEYLCSIKQTGSVHEYRHEFIRRSARISNWPDHCLLRVFLNGLKDELKADVSIHKPRTVYKAMSLALEFESKINHCCPIKKTTLNSQLKPDSKPFTPGSYSPVLANQPKPYPKANLRITDAEKQNHFLKEECFRCGDKYGPGHRCKTGTFKVLEAEEENGEHQEIKTSILDINPDETARISLHAILEKPHPTTMKVHGKLNSIEVLILIDGGSTHNFISDILVSELKLVTQLVALFGDFHPFSLGGADLVLGIQCQDMEQHTLHLEQTLKLLHDKHFFVKLSKCYFGQTKVLFLGHVVTFEGVQVEQEKISAVQSWPIPSNVKQEDISMDFIVGLPPSNWFDTILVVVDRLSKYTHFICLSHPFTAKSVASVFCKEIVRLHGLPRSIVSDRDVIFLSNFWQVLFRLSQTMLQLSTSYHPQMDGKMEVLNRCLEAYLQCFVAVQPTKWSSYLPWAEFSYNAGAQDRMRNQANSHRRELSFQLPSDARIHPVFHVSMLKPAHSSFDDTAINPLPVTKDWEADLQPDSVISHRWVYEAGNLVLDLLISWSNRPVEEATWESYDFLKEKFSNFRLEDKSFYQEGSNDTTGLQVYTRKHMNGSKHMTRTQMNRINLMLFLGFGWIHWSVKE